MGVWVQAPSSLSQLSHLEQVTEPNLPLFQNCKVGATDRSFLGLCEINKERHVFRAGTLELNIQAPVLALSLAHHVNLHQLLMSDSPRSRENDSPCLLGSYED